MTRMRRNVTVRLGDHRLGIVPLFLAFLHNCYPVMIVLARAAIFTVDVRVDVHCRAACTPSSRFPLDFRLLVASRFVDQFDDSTR
ncbi:MAG: hypothetical protein K2I40_06515 [Bifidobacterium castoris]|nr:hypothetical protein [Bifidobacterium castoris]